MSSLSIQFNLRQDIGGMPGDPINSPLDIGDRFFAEVLMGDIRSNAVGLVSSTINLNFQSGQIQNIDNPFNPSNLNSPLVTSNFTLLREGTLNNLNGTITNLGGASFPAIDEGLPIGINQLERFSLMHFQVLRGGDSQITLNVDLDQTAFADGSLPDPTDQSEFSQIIPITTENTPPTVPEPSLSLGGLLVTILILVYCSLRWGKFPEN